MANQLKIYYNDFTNSMDQKLVKGYLKNIHLQMGDIVIPNDVINLIFLFYHIYLIAGQSWKHYNNWKYKLSNNNMIVTIRSHWTGGPGGVCYGASVIPSVDGGVYKWEFKILKRTCSMAIGIDEARYIRTDYGSFNDKIGESISYALWHNGRRNKWNHDGIMKADDNSPHFSTNDVIIMILDLSSKTISYKINDGHEQIVFKNITTADDINYCMGVWIGYNGDSVQLLD